MALAAGTSNSGFIVDSVVPGYCSLLGLVVLGSGLGKVMRRV